MALLFLHFASLLKRVSAATVKHYMEKCAQTGKNKQENQTRMACEMMSTISFIPGNDCSCWLLKSRGI